MNLTFIALTLFPCDGILELERHNVHDPYWRQSVLGCIVIDILQDMYTFNITYVVGGGDSKLVLNEHQKASFTGSVDIYVKPLYISASLLEKAFAVQPLFNWRIGFLLRDESNAHSQRFYTLPFTPMVWCCIYAMIVVGSLLFYVLGKWERRLIGSRSNFAYEIFIAFSAVCQHILPLHAVLCSRRIAYFSFIMGTYVIHCFYTSNLLSRLVSDTGNTMGLEELARSDYEIALLKDMNLSATNKFREVPLDRNLSIVINKLKKTKMMHLRPALDAVMYGKTALITDFVTLYPIIKKLYSMREICELVEIDFYSNIQYYFVTSKKFLYIEQFRIGIIRLRENGILKAILRPSEIIPVCDNENIFTKAEMEQLSGPIMLLFLAYVLATIILIGEKIHYSRNKLLPYME